MTSAGSPGGRRIGAARSRGLRLKHVKRVQSKGHNYYYFDTGKVEDGKRVHARLPDPSAPDFGSVYAAYLGHRNRRSTVAAGITAPKLVQMYMDSDKFRELAPNSQDLYNTYLTRFAKLMPTAPAAEITQRDMQLLFDGLGKTPGAANMVLATVGAMYKWAVKRGHATINPCLGIEPNATGEHSPWPVPLVEAALASDEPLVRLLTHLLYYTAQRIGDVLHMRWSDIRGDVLHLTQEKTDKPLTIPLHRALRDELARTSRTGLLIVGNGEQPMKRALARKHLQRFAAARGFKVVPHGLRKNAVNALLEAGCSVAETAAISGQSLRIVEHYAKERNRTKLAASAVLMWEKNG